MELAKLAESLIDLEKERITGWTGPSGAAYNVVSEDLEEKGILTPSWTLTPLGFRLRIFLETGIDPDDFDVASYKDFTMSELDFLKDELSIAIDHEVKDYEAEAALAGEGIHVWGPDGDRFCRMFSVVMGIRANELHARDKEREKLR